MTTERRRAVFRIDEEILHRALNLPEGQHVIGFLPDPLRLSIDVCVEGDGLPACPLGTEPDVVNAEPYTTRFSPWMLRGAELEERVRELAGKWQGGRHSDAATALLRVLDEGWRA